MQEKAENGVTAAIADELRESANRRGIAPFLPQAHFRPPAQRVHARPAWVIGDETRVPVETRLTVWVSQDDPFDEFLGSRFADRFFYDGGLAGFGVAHQIELARRVMHQGLSVRETETLVARLPEAASPGDSLRRQDGDRPARLDLHLGALEQELIRALGTNVRLNPCNKGGRIEIEYYSNEELEGLVRRLKR